MPVSTPQTGAIRWFSELTLADVPLVGGKNASLGELVRELTPQGIHIPNGFAVMARAYHYYLREAKLDEQICSILSDLDTRDINNLRDRGRRVRQAILAAPLPNDLERAIIEAYRQLSQGFRDWWTWRSAAAPRPRICRTPASRGSRRLI